MIKEELVQAWISNEIQEGKQVKGQYTNSAS